MSNTISCCVCLCCSDTFIIYTHHARMRFFWAQTRTHIGLIRLVLSCLVLSYVLANTPMESNGQGWGAWSSLVETSKEPVCPRVELILKIIIILLIIFLGFIKSKPC